MPKKNPVEELFEIIQSDLEQNINNLEDGLTEEVAARDKKMAELLKDVNEKENAYGSGKYFNERFFDSIGWRKRLPEVIADKTEFNDKAKNKFRVYHADRWDKNVTLDTMRNEFLGKNSKGETVNSLQYFGGGELGGGTYFSDTLETAEAFGDIYEDIRHYTIMKGYVNKNAKVIKASEMLDMDLEKQQMSPDCLMAKFAKRYPETFNVIMDGEPNDKWNFKSYYEDRRFSNRCRDKMSAIAAFFGKNIIVNESEINVFDRSALTMCGEEAKYDQEKNNAVSIIASITYDELEKQEQVKATQSQLDEYNQEELDDGDDIINELIPGHENSYDKIYENLIRDEKINKEIIPDTSRDEEIARKLAQDFEAENNEYKRNESIIGDDESAYEGEIYDDEEINNEEIIPDTSKDEEIARKLAQDFEAENNEYKRNESIIGDDEEKIIEPIQGLEETINQYPEHEELLNEPIQGLEETINQYPEPEELLNGSHQRLEEIMGPHQALEEPNFIINEDDNPNANRDEEYYRNDLFETQLATQLGYDNWEQASHNCRVCDKNGRMVNPFDKTASQLLRDNDGELYIISNDGELIVPAFLEKANGAENYLCGQDNIAESLERRDDYPVLSFFEKILRLISTIFKWFETDRIRAYNECEKESALIRGDFPRPVKEKAEQDKRDYLSLADDSFDAEINNNNIRNINEYSTNAEAGRNKVEKESNTMLKGIKVKEYLENIVHMEGDPGMKKYADEARSLLDKKVYEDPEFVNRINKDVMNHLDAGNHDNLVNDKTRSNARKENVNKMGPAIHC